MKNSKARLPFLTHASQLKYIPEDVLRNPKFPRTRRFMANNMWKRHVLSFLGEIWINCTNAEDFININTFEVKNNEKGINGVFNMVSLNMVEIIGIEGLENTTIFILDFSGFKIAALIEEDGRILNYGSFDNEDFGGDVGIEIINNITWDTPNDENGWVIKFSIRGKGTKPKLRKSRKYHKSRKYRKSRKSKR